MEIPVSNNESDTRGNYNKIHDDRIFDYNYQEIIHRVLINTTHINVLNKKDSSGRSYIIVNVEERHF